MIYFILLMMNFIFAGQNCWSPVKQSLSSAKGFSMVFSQIDSYSFIDDKKKSKGNLIVSLPDKFFWKSKGDDDPGATIVSNGKTIWFYQPSDDPRDKGMLYINSASESVNIPAILLSCPEDNLVSYIKRGNTRTIYVTGGDDNNFKWARIRFKIKPFRFIELIFESYSNAKTLIIVDSFKLNRDGFSPSMFEFKVPNGTRIIK